MSTETKTDRHTHTHIHRDIHKQSLKQKHSPHIQKQTPTETQTPAFRFTHRQTPPHTHIPRDRCVWTHIGTHGTPRTHSGNTKTDTNAYAQQHTVIETDIHRETLTV